MDWQLVASYFTEKSTDIFYSVLARQQKNLTDFLTNFCFWTFFLWFSKAANDPKQGSPFIFSLISEFQLFASCF